MTSWWRHRSIRVRLTLWYAAALSAVLRGFAGAASGIVGPGIGRDMSTRRLIEDLVPKVTVPLVLDADALNLLSEHRTILPRLSPQIVLTPHPAEFARLSGLDDAMKDAVAARFLAEPLRNEQIDELFKFYLH